MTTVNPLFQVLASLVQARQNCADNNPEWFDRHEGRAEHLARNHLPSGAGFDSGTNIDWDKTTPEKLVFTTSFHHMDKHGGYDGWTEHEITVKPSLAHGFTLKIGGRNRNDIKGYISDTFYEALREPIDTNEVFKRI